VEYSAAVDRYLAQAALTPASRRVYRISLTGWAWPLVGKQIPTGPARRRAPPPVVPLALLDDPETGARLAAAFADRAASTDARTVNRELSALRSAIAWWLRRHWLSSDPTEGLRHVASHPQVMPPLDHDQATRLFRAAPSLREHAFWRVLYDTGATAEEVLRLDAGNLDLPRHRARLRPSPGTASRPSVRSHTAGGQGAPAPTWITWREGTSQLLRWLVAGRPDGPVFLTDRRAPASADPTHVCPLTGRARMSYRRAVEIFAAATRPLDPAGKGWSLQQLRQPPVPHKR
jgi:integrase